MSKLVEGHIPANTKCPWRDQCCIAQGGACGHKGVDHPVPFSCASARAFDMFKKNERKK